LFYSRNLCYCHGSRGCCHQKRADDDTYIHKGKLGIQEGTRLMVDTEGNKVVLTKIPSIFDLAGKSKLTTAEAFRLLDEMRVSEG